MGTVVSGPGSFLYFGLQLTQDEDMNVTIHADNKIDAIECYPIDRLRRKQINETLNKVELHAFRSVNSTLGWIGNSASLFCALYASHLQQKSPEPIVKDLISQINAVKLLKKLGSVVLYKRPTFAKESNVAILVFSDASRSHDTGQLCYIAGLLFGTMNAKSVFHTISWSSRKSKRPVKSIGAAETLSAGEAIDEGKLLAKTFEFLLNVQVPLWIAVDSKDLFTTLSTCRNSVDRSIRGDVSVIRYEFETGAVSKMIWIEGKTNLADPGTKPNSPLVSTLQLTMASGELSIEFIKSEERSSDQFLG